MKRKIYLNSLLCLLLMSFVPGKTCSGDAEYEKGIKGLKDFTLVKDFRISLKKGKKGELPPFETFPISLNAGFKYKFMIINNDDNKSKMVMGIYANAKREIQFVSSYSTLTKKHYESVEFESKTTGTFYIAFQFENGEPGCGVGIFAVQNK